MGIITNLLDFLLVPPFGWLFKQSYFLTGSFLAALIVYAVVLRAVMAPFSFRGQKSQARQMVYQAKVEALKRKYANDRQKLQDEQTKLMQQEGGKMFSGCFTMLIPLFLLLPVYRVVYKPLTYILDVSAEAVNSAVEAFKVIGVEVNAGRPELDIISNMSSENGTAIIRECFGDKADSVLGLNVHLFGANLAELPNIGVFNLIWLVPFFSAATAMLSMWMSTRASKAAGMPSMGGMLFMMPLISLWMGYVFPASLGIYWGVSNLITMCITMAINKYYSAAIINAKDDIKLRNARLLREKAIKEQAAGVKN